MKLTNTTLVDFSGEPIVPNPKADPPEQLTLARALMNCAMAPGLPGANGQPPQRTPQEIVQRYDLALRLYKLAVGEQFELEVDMAAKLKAEVAGVFQIVVAGQIINMLDQKH